MLSTVATRTSYMWERSATGECRSLLCIHRLSTSLLVNLRGGWRPAYSGRDVRFGRWHHLKSKAERRDLVARMIIGISQLRQPIKLLRFFRGALIDSGIKVDQVLARFASCCEMNDDVALAVKAAGIAHVSVVIGRDVDVVIFGPADALEANCHGRARWSELRRDADNAGFDNEERSRDESIAAPQDNFMQAAEVLWNRQGRFEFSVAFYLDLYDDILLRLKT